MKEIPLTKGKVAIVDDDDYEHLSEYKWSAFQISPGTFVAVRQVYLGGPQPAIYMHRWLMQPEHGEIVEHINGDHLDNRRENLRACTRADKIAPSKTNRSGYVGISRNRGKWQAYITHRGDRIHIGTYDTAEEAAKARDEKARELLGNSAVLNFTETDMKGV